LRTLYGFRFGHFAVKNILPPSTQRNFFLKSSLFNLFTIMKLKSIYKIVFPEANVEENRNAGLFEMFTILSLEILNKFLHSQQM